jgi:hypothetical protein
VGFFIGGMPLHGSEETFDINSSGRRSLRASLARPTTFFLDGYMLALTMNQGLALRKKLTKSIEIGLLFIAWTQRNRLVEQDLGADANRWLKGWPLSPS